MGIDWRMHWCVALLFECSFMSLSCLDLMLTSACVVSAPFAVDSFMLVRLYSAATLLRFRHVTLVSLIPLRACLWIGCVPVCPCARGLAVCPCARVPVDFPCARAPWGDLSRNLVWWSLYNAVKFCGERFWPISCVRPNTVAVTIKKRISLYFGRTLFWVFSFVPKIVLFGARPRAKNRALDRAFWCSPSCQKSCFLVLSFVPQIVLFCGAFPRAKNRALDRAFWCSPSCQKSCSRF